MPTMIDIHDWDRAPAARILTWSLPGSAFVTGNEVDLEQTLDELAAAGLTDHRRPSESDFPCPHQTPETINGMWVVSLTHAGQSAGLMLAASVDLVQILDLAARIALGGYDWPGVEMRRLVRELDLRMGGDGEFPDMGKWLRETSRPALADLPRREGLDAPAPAELPEDHPDA